MAAQKKTTSTAKDSRKDMDKPEPIHKQMTIDGLKITINRRITEDFRFQRGLLKIKQIETSGVTEDSPEMVDYLETMLEVAYRLFGPDKDRVIAHIEAKNDGIVSMQDLGRFMMKVIEKLSPSS